MVIPSLTPFCSLFQANAWPKQNGRTNRYQWFNIYPPAPRITHYNGLTIHFPREFSVPPRCKIHRALNLLQLICCSPLSGNSMKKNDELYRNPTVDWFHLLLFWNAYIYAWVLDLWIIFTLCTSPKCVWPTPKMCPYKRKLSVDSIHIGELNNGNNFSWIRVRSHITNSPDNVLRDAWPVDENRRATNRHWIHAYFPNYTTDGCILHFSRCVCYALI